MPQKIASGWIDILAPLKGLRAGFSNIERESKKAGDKASSKFGKAFKAGIVVASAAAGAELVSGFGDALNRGKLEDKLGAALGASTAEAERYGDEAGALFADAYGESLGEVHGAIESVESTLGRLVDTSGDRLSDLTARALDFAGAFDVDLDDAVKNAGRLIETGLAGDAVEAFDLLTAAAQKVPKALRGELLDSVDEYAQHFSSLGFSGPQALGLLSSAAERGQYVLDKTGDAMKEFTALATDGSESTGNAFAMLGIRGKDYDRMVKMLLAGGPKAGAAFKTMAKALHEIEDPIKKADVAMALFGTPLEDMDKTRIPDFVAALYEGTEGLEDFAGASDRLGEQLNDNDATKIEAYRRSVEDMSASIGEKALGAVTKLPGPLRDVAAGIQGIAGPAMSIVSAVGPMAGGLMAMSAAQTTAAGTSTLLSSAMAALPFVAIGLAVAALAVIVWRNWDSIKEAIGGAVSWVKDRFEDFKRGLGLVRDFLLGLWEKVNPFQVLIDGANAVIQAPDKIREAFANVTQAIVRPFALAWNEIARLWNGTIGTLSANIPGIGPIGMPKIPEIQGLANGGLVTSAGMFTVGERGRENVFLPAGSAVSPIPSGSDPAGRTMASATAVVVNVAGSVTSERDLVSKIRDGLADIASRNGGFGVPA